MNFLSTSMHVLFWWWGLPGWWIACCKYRREGEIRGHQIPLYLRWITFCNNKEHSLKEPRTLVLGFVLLSWSYTWKSSIAAGSPSSSHTSSLPPFSSSQQRCSCLSLSVSLPLFWHLHAVKDRQEKTQALMASPETKSTLWWSIMQLENDWWTFCISAGLRRWRCFKRSRSHVRKDEK